MTRRSKKRRPLTGPDRQRYGVSVSRETYRLLQGASIARGMSMAGVVEEACRGVGDDCCDCVAERAGGL